MKICKNCNKAFNDSISFCPNCGSQLVLIEDNTQFGNEQQENQPAQPNQADQAFQEEIQSNQAEQQEEQVNQNSLQEYKPDQDAQQEKGQYAGKMNFKDAVLTCVKKYVCFEGRAKRTEFWYFTLAIMSCWLILYFCDLFMHKAIEMTDLYVLASLWSFMYYLLAFVLAAGLFLPVLTAIVRRFHDGGHSGVAIIKILIPFAGPFIIISYLAQRSEPHDNKYGPYVTVN